MQTIQVGTTIPKKLAKEIDSLVDGVKYRSRSHFIHSAIIELVKKESSNEIIKKKQK